MGSWLLDPEILIGLLFFLRVRPLDAYLLDNFYEIISADVEVHMLSCIVSFSSCASVQSIHVICTATVRIFASGFACVNSPIWSFCMNFISSCMHNCCNSELCFDWLLSISTYFLGLTLVAGLWTYFWSLPQNYALHGVLSFVCLFESSALACPSDGSDGNYSYT
jgi:hypothetical protein